MNNKKKKIIITIIAIAVVAVIAVTAIILTKNLSGNGDLKATIVNVSSAKELIKDYIIEWDSTTKEHTKPEMDENAKCSIAVNNNVYNYEDISECWIAANTTYKNTGAVEVTLYSDWIANDEGVFGTDSNNDYFGNTGSVKIWGWKSDITINLNGYKIDRNLGSTTVENGETLTIDNSNNVYIKNGCITGGADNGDGGGVWIKGEDTRGYFENMTITGNISGTKGGGIYASQKLSNITLTDTIIEGNYAADCGAGMFVDYTKNYLDSSDGVLSLYGTIIIKDNIAGDNTRRNLTFRSYSSAYEQSSKMEKVEIDSESCIYVSLSEKGECTKTIVKPHILDKEIINYFHADNENANVILKTKDTNTNVGTADRVYLYIEQK